MNQNKLTIILGISLVAVTVCSILVLTYIKKSDYVSNARTISSPQPSPTTDPSTLALFESKELGFKFYYPKDFNLVLERKGLIAYPPSNEGNILITTENQIAKVNIELQKAGPEQIKILQKATEQIQKSFEFFKEI